MTGPALASEPVEARNAPWTPAAGAPALPSQPRPSAWRKLMPFVGPALLFIVWDAVVRFGFIKAILLPLPMDTLLTLVTGLAGGPLLTDFAVTVKRTLQAFA
ncbi:MAG: ABC transporter permease, partial [Bacteriovorax sp.]|nr:ABC transporter permease [Rhizobacter sp.]